MGQLMPEPRADKNGRVVTRHVKTDDPGNASANSIPRPVLNYEPVVITPAMQTRIINRIIKATGAENLRFHGGPNIKQNLDYIARRSPREFLALDDEIKNADEWLRRNWGVSLEAIKLAPARQPAGKTERDALPDFLRTKVVVRMTAELTRDDGIDPNGTALRGAALRGLIGKIRQSDHDTVRAAMVATWILPRTDNGSYIGADYEGDRDSFEYIKENYEKVMANRVELRARGSIDPEVMDMIVNSEASALNSGLL